MGGSSSRPFIIDDFQSDDEDEGNYESALDEPLVENMTPDPGNPAPSTRESNELPEPPPARESSPSRTATGSKLNLRELQELVQLLEANDFENAQLVARELKANLVLQEIAGTAPRLEQEVPDERHVVEPEHIPCRQESMLSAIREVTTSSWSSKIQEDVLSPADQSESKLAEPGSCYQEPQLVLAQLDQELSQFEVDEQKIASETPFIHSGIPRLKLAMQRLPSAENVAVQRKRTPDRRRSPSPQSPGGRAKPSGIPRYSWAHATPILSRSLSEESRSDQSSDSSCLSNTLESLAEMSGTPQPTLRRPTSSADHDRLSKNRLRREHSGSRLTGVGFQSSELEDLGSDLAAWGDIHMSDITGRVRLKKTHEGVASLWSKQDQPLRRSELPGRCDVSRSEELQTSPGSEGENSPSSSEEAQTVLVSEGKYSEGRSAELQVTMNHDGKISRSRTEKLKKALESQGRKSPSGIEERRTAMIGVKYSHSRSEELKPGIDNQGKNSYSRSEEHRATIATEGNNSLSRSGETNTAIESRNKNSYCGPVELNTASISEAKKCQSRSEQLQIALGSQSKRSYSGSDEILKKVTGSECENSHRSSEEIRMKVRTMDMKNCIRKKEGQADLGDEAKQICSRSNEENKVTGVECKNIYRSSEDLRMGELIEEETSCSRTEELPTDLGSGTRSFSRSGKLKSNTDIEYKNSHSLSKELRTAKCSKGKNICCDTEELQTAERNEEKPRYSRSDELKEVTGVKCKNIQSSSEELRIATGRESKSKCCRTEDFSIDLGSEDKGRHKKSNESKKITDMKSERSNSGELRMALCGDCKKSCSRTEELQTDLGSEIQLSCSMLEELNISSGTVIKNSNSGSDQLQNVYCHDDKQHISSQEEVKSVKATNSLSRTEDLKTTVSSEDKISHSKTGEIKTGWGSESELSQNHSQSLDRGTVMDKFEQHSGSTPQEPHMNARTHSNHGLGVSRVSSSALSTDQTQACQVKQPLGGPAQRKVLDLKRWYCISRPQYKSSCGVAALVSCWNFLFSSLGYGSLKPLTQEVAMELLGFSPPFDSIKFGPITGNMTILKWFTQLNSHFKVSGMGSILYKPKGNHQTPRVTSQMAQESLKRGLRDKTTAFIYHCHNHYFCPIGYEISTELVIDAYKEEVDRDENARTWVLMGDSSNKHPAILCKSWEDIDLDLNCESPDYFDIRQSWKGILHQEKIKLPGQNCHCIMALYKLKGSTWSTLPDSSERTESLSLSPVMSSSLSSSTTDSSASPEKFVASNLGSVVNAQRPELTLEAEGGIQEDEILSKLYAPILRFHQGMRNPPIKNRRSSGTSLPLFPSVIEEDEHPEPDLKESNQLPECISQSQQESQGQGTRFSSTSYQQNFKIHQLSESYDCQDMEQNAEWRKMSASYTQKCLRNQHPELEFKSSLDSKGAIARKNATSHKQKLDAGDRNYHCSNLNCESPRMEQGFVINKDSISHKQKSERSLNLEKALKSPLKNQLHVFKANTDCHNQNLNMSFMHQDSHKELENCITTQDRSIAHHQDFIRKHDQPHIRNSAYSTGLPERRNKDIQGHSLLLDDSQEEADAEYSCTEMAEQMIGRNKLQHNKDLEYAVVHEQKYQEDLVQVYLEDLEPCQEDEEESPLIRSS